MSDTTIHHDARSSECQTQQYIMMHGPLNVRHNNVALF